MATVIATKAKPPALIFGLDVVCILVFALLARIAHSDARGLTLFTWFDTAWPFLVGVFIGWVILALTKLEALYVAPAGLIVWVCAAATGLTIWGIRHEAIPHSSFIVVASVMSAILLLGYRGIMTRASKR